jgi:hypothetical protein
MNTLKDRIAEGRELAVQRTRETEPEVSWFVAATKVDYSIRTGEPSSVYVVTHFRSWHQYIDEGTFGDPRAEEIAQRLIGWVRDAMELEFLVADDPPRAQNSDPKARLVDLMQVRLAELRAEAGLPPA